MNVILTSISDIRYMCTVSLLLQLLLIHGNTVFGFLLTHPYHPSLVCHSPGHTSVHTGFVGHLADRLHSWLLFSLLSMQTSRASSTELLPSCSVFPLSGHLSNMLLSSHLLRVGRLLPLPQHTTESTWLQIFVGPRPLKVKFFCKHLPTISWSNYSWFHSG